MYAGLGNPWWIPSKYGRTMKLLEVARILSLLDESIDIHGLARIHKGNPEFEQAVKDYRATLQGRKKELLKPFGLDDLDKFKEKPEDFVEMVGYAVDSFKEKKEQKALYKKIYEDDRCLITMPRGPKGAAAAGSLCKKGGEAVCPWCVATKFPDNMRWWDKYEAEAVFFFYAKKGGAPVNAWCMVLTVEDCMNVLGGDLSFSQMESLKNAVNPSARKRLFKSMCGQTGLDDTTVISVLKTAITPFKEEITEKSRPISILRALGSAIAKGDVETVNTLLSSGDFDINAMDNKGNTPLFAAAAKKNLEICRLLIDAGADVDASNNSHETPLIIAATAGDENMCRLFIDAGADVDGGLFHSLSPLCCAAGEGHLEVCRLLLDAGASI